MSDVFKGINIYKLISFFLNMDDLEIVVKDGEMVINPKNGHYMIGSPESVSVSARPGYRELALIYNSTISSESIDELSRFEYDFDLLQLSSEKNIWRTEITINTPKISISFE